jgi:cytoskeletal protein CcmA (bactofilin family)/predicted Zn-ribbon and HTH transcriptional regulator
VAKNRKVNTLDSYATIRAVARTKPLPVSQPAAKDAVPTDAVADLQKPGARVARTTVPVKHSIECYECGYKFQVHGRATTTHCPKCRVLLDFKDYLIDSEWVETIKTAGTIRLTATGVLKSGDLIGAEVIIEGIIEGGRARALRTIELGAGAIFSEKAVSAPDLRIAPGAEFKFKQEARYHNIEIYGTLHAKLESTGIIIVKPGGLLSGEVHAQHLVVEEGGGLQAMLRIAPKSEAVPEGEEAA